MTKIEKAPSLEDYKISELLETSMQVIQTDRKKEILANVQPGQGLNQGIEHFYANAQEVAREIVGSRDLDKVNAQTVLKGYIAARYLENVDLKDIYVMALRRKGIDDFALLESIIDVSERSFHNVNESSILEIYRKGAGN